MYYLLRISGFDTSRIPDGAETRFAWGNPQVSWMALLYLALVAGLAYGVFYLYRRELDTCPRWARLTLATIRVGILLLLALVFLNPTVAWVKKTEFEPYVVLLIDGSQSFGKVDSYLDETSIAPVLAATGRTAESIRAKPPTRLEIAADIFNKDNGAILRQLASRGNLKVMTFASKTSDVYSLRREGKSSDAKTESEKLLDKPAGGANLPALGDNSALATSGVAPDAAATSDGKTPPTLVQLPPLSATGSSTLIAKAIRETLKKMPGSPIAGIVLVSDGQDTAKDDDPLAAADRAGLQKTPLFTVGVGDPNKPKSITLTDFYADEQVWRSDPFEMQATVQSQGFDKLEIEIELTEQALDANGTPVGSATSIERRKLTLNETGGPQKIAFKHAQKKNGSYVYTAQIPPQKDESPDAVNIKTVNVKVLEEKARVLLIAGAPTWEYRLVSGLYIRDPTIDVSCWLQSMDPEMQQEGNTPIAKLPFTYEELGKYDLIMMFDPEPEEFNEAWFAALKKYVADRAGGFLYMAGPKYSSRFFSTARTQAIKDVLPVTLTDVNAMELESLTAKSNREWPLSVVPAELDHPVMRFDTDAKTNRDRWEKMPGIFWSFPLKDIKPASHVLLEHSDIDLRTPRGPRPLLVTNQYGGGRTAFMGFNGTWRWRRVGRDAEYFNKYWVQMCRYLVEGKLLSSKRRGTIDLGGEKFHVGDQIVIKANLTDAGFRPLEEKKVVAKVADAKGNAFNLDLKPSASGQFTGSMIGSSLGKNRITINLPGEKTGEAVSVSKDFDVEVSRIEFDDSRLNRGKLREWAEKSGGKYFDIDHVSEIAANIPDRTETQPLISKPEHLWDNSHVLILLVALLTIEWAARKRFKLM